MNYNVLQNNNRMIGIVITVIFALIYTWTDCIQDNLHCNNSRCSVETKNLFGMTVSKQNFILTSVDSFTYDTCQGVDFHKSKREHRTPLCVFTINKYNHSSTQITKAPIRSKDRIQSNIEDLNNFLKEKIGNIEYNF